MFTLLAPPALAASVVLALPVIIHLLRPKQVRTMPFSSLRWLRTSKHKLSRRIQWHQLLLFFLRASLLASLVFALAKPVASRIRPSGSCERFLVIDVSRSMSYSLTGVDTPLDRAKRAAISVLDRGLPGDRSSLVIVGNEATLLGPPTGDPGAYRAHLESANCLSCDTNLGSALGLIRDLLSPSRPGVRAELFFFTDNHEGSWSQQSITDFTAGLKIPVSVHVVDVGPVSPCNAWIAEVRAVGIEGRRFLRARLGASGTEPLERTLRLSRPVIPGGSAHRVTLFPGAITEVDLPLPPVLDGAEHLAELVLEPRDALSEDDLFWLSLDDIGPRVLILEPLTTHIEALQPGHHVRAALDVISQGNSAGPRVVRRSPESLAASDLEQADIVIMADVPGLSDDRLLALETRVNKGAGLLLFLGPSARSDFYRSRLHNALRPEISLLPAPPGDTASEGLEGLKGVLWTHPLLARFGDPVFSDLSRLRSKSHYRLSSLTDSNFTRILARFEDGAPAFVEHAVGAGRVLILNTTPNDEWSDLPRRSSFLPLLDSVLDRLAFTKHSRGFRVGDPILVPIPNAGEPVQISVTAPSGRNIPFTISGEGARSVVHIRDAESPGVYTLRSIGSEGATQSNFVVHAGLGDASVRKADPESLRLWWNGVSFNLSHPDPKLDPLPSPPASRVILWPILLGVAALVLMAETYLTHRLTSAMSPPITRPSSTGGLVFSRQFKEEVRP